MLGPKPCLLTAHASTSCLTHEASTRHRRQQQQQYFFCIMGGSWRVFFAVLSASVAGEERLRVSPQPKPARNRRKPGTSSSHDTCVRVRLSTSYTDGQHSSSRHVFQEQPIHAWLLERALFVLFFPSGYPATSSSPDWCTAQ